MIAANSVSSGVSWVPPPCARTLDGGINGSAISHNPSVRHAVLVAERVRVREIDDDEGQHLPRIVRRGTGSAVTWRRAKMVLLSAQHMDVNKIATVTFTSPDRVRDVIHNFNADGFEALYLKYKGGRPKTFTAVP